MDPAKQQILGYFIEEAKEHLDTLESGLLNLQSTISDSERVNELFRAAHSVKGGAAMLGYGSIQKTAHRLEDSFKVLKEQDITADQQLETLFLSGFDTLRDLIEKLQGPFGLQEEEGEQAFQAAEPIFTQLETYLQELSGGAGAAATIPANFDAQVMGVLKQMLALFKQADSAASRQKLQGLCDRAQQLVADNQPWQTLTTTVKTAISNPGNSFQSIAPVVIRDLKQAAERLKAGKQDAVVPSGNLKQLAAATTSAATPTATPPTSAAGADQVLVPKNDPKGAAIALIKGMDKKTLTDMAKILIHAIKSGKV